MISPWLVYFILMLDNIAIASGFFVIFSIIFFIIIFIAYCTDTGENEYCRIHEKTENLTCKMKKMYSFTKVVLFVFSVTFMLGMFLPSTKQAIAIYLIPKLAQSEYVKQIPQQLEIIVNNLLNDKESKK
jgi:hypothetical protein